jgi:hypothetical protein
MIKTYRIIILSVVLCRCEGHRSREVKKIFEPMWEEVRGSFRKLYNKKLHNLHSSHIIRMRKSIR